MSCVCHNAEASLYQGNNFRQKSDSLLHYCTQNNLGYAVQQRLVSDSIPALSNKGLSISAVTARNCSSSRRPSLRPCLMICRMCCISLSSSNCTCDSSKPLVKTTLQRQHGQLTCMARRYRMIAVCKVHEAKWQPTMNVMQYAGCSKVQLFAARQKQTHQGVTGLKKLFQSHHVLSCTSW